MHRACFCCSQVPKKISYGWFERLNVYFSVLSVICAVSYFCYFQPSLFNFPVSSMQLIDFIKINIVNMSTNHRRGLASFKRSQRKEVRVLGPVWENSSMHTDGEKDPTGHLLDKGERILIRGGTAKSLCVLFISVCGEGTFIILIGSVSSTPMCVIECWVCVEWKMTLKFIKWTDLDGKLTWAHDVSVMWFFANCTWSAATPHTRSSYWCLQTQMYSFPLHLLMTAVPVIDF